MANKNTRISQYAEAPQGLYEEGVERLSEVMHETEDLVRDNPLTSSLVTLGAGFALGLLVTSLVAPSRHSRRRAVERNIPDWVSREHIVEAISRWLPESLKSCK